MRKLKLLLFWPAWAVLIVGFIGALQGHPVPALLALAIVGFVTYIVARLTNGVLRGKDLS